jgi:hypothetical protein
VTNRICAEEQIGFYFAGNLNAYHGVHALRERANKIGEGIIVIRSEGVLS